MAKTMRSIPARVGTVAVEGLELVILGAAAALGGWVGSNVPGPLSAWSAALAGAFGLGLAFGAMELLDSFIGSLRALTRTPSSPAYAPHDQQDTEALPITPEDIVKRLQLAAQADAAQQAAQNSWRLDHARDLLHTAERWVGFDDNTALFPLIDGTYVQYRKKDDGESTNHEYPFIVAEADTVPVTLTSMAQLHDLMQQHASREPRDQTVDA